MLNTDSIQINGPFNLIRLEGVVNNVKKVIYLFADVHRDVSEQTACENVFAQDISQYLAKNFLKLNKSSKLAPNKSTSITTCC